MNASHSKSYHYPRWPLIRQTSECMLWLLVGIMILCMPAGHARWLGLLPLVYCIIQWRFGLLPRWKHVIRLDEKKLMIGSHAYEWNQFDQMRIDRAESTREIRLVGREGTLNLVIKDDLQEFDELARDCFFYMNQMPQIRRSAGAIKKKKIT